MDKSTMKKFIFNLSTLVIVTFFGNIFIVLLHVYNNNSLFFPKYWITADSIAFLILGVYFFRKVISYYKAVLLVGFPVILFLSILWYILPIKIPSEYLGLRKTDKDGYILADEYCKKDCPITTMLLDEENFHKERTFYSWRYAELLGRLPADNSCCFGYRPFDIEYLFGILLVLEITFEYIPLIFFITLIITIYGYYKKKKFIEQEFTLLNELDITRINIVGVILILVIIFYNILYMYYL